MAFHSTACVLMRSWLKEVENANAMSRVVSNIVDGLSEVQVNNMQSYQMSQLDHVMRKQIENKEGLVSYLDRVYK